MARNLEPACALLDTDGADLVSIAAILPLQPSAGRLIQRAL